MSANGVSPSGNSPGGEERGTAIASAYSIRIKHLRQGPPLPLPQPLPAPRPTWRVLCAGDQLSRGNTCFPGTFKDEFTNREVRGGLQGARSIPTRCPRSRRPRRRQAPRLLHNLLCFPRLGSLPCWPMSFSCPSPWRTLHWALGPSGLGGGAA